MTAGSPAQRTPKPLALSVSGVVSVLAVALVFMPKIGLAQIGGLTVPLRIDDFVIALLFPVVIAYRFRGRAVLTPVEAWFALLTVALIVSWSTSTVAHGRSNLLFALRSVEYFAFFYFGLFVGGRLLAILHWYCVLNGIAIVAQYLGLVGGLTSLGYVYPIEPLRPPGLTGGPWEIGVILNFYFALRLSGSRSIDVSTVWTFAWTMALIGLTGSRIPLIAHLMLAGVYVMRHASPFQLLATAVGGTALFVGLTLGGLPTLERLGQVANQENLGLFFDIRSHYTIESFESFAILAELPSEDGIDYSWFIRMNQWAIAAGIWIGEPSAWWFGLGPGIWGGSLDGGWLRVVTEVGVVGLAAFVGLLAATAALSTAMALFTAALALNMVFIDVNLAYKVMAVYWLCAGAASVGRTHLVPVSGQSPGTP
jgi:hypothetical protein